MGKRIKSPIVKCDCGHFELCSECRQVPSERYKWVCNFCYNKKEKSIHK